MSSDSLEKSFFQDCRWLNHCGHDGIILNSNFNNLGQTPWNSLALKITTDTIKPCQRFLQAIMDIPISRNIADIRSWFGIVNQVSYCTSMTDEIKPFKEILKLSDKFYWDDQL